MIVKWEAQSWNREIAFWSRTWPRGDTGKLRSHWEETLHKVVRRVNKDTPVYELVPEQGRGRDCRILHRNILLLCDYLPLEVPLKVAKARRKIVKKTSWRENRRSTWRWQWWWWLVLLLFSTDSPECTSRRIYWPDNRLWINRSTSQAGRRTGKIDAIDEGSRWSSVVGWGLGFRGTRNCGRQPCTATPATPTKWQSQRKWPSARVATERTMSAKDVHLYWAW